MREIKYRVFNKRINKMKPVERISFAGNYVQVNGDRESFIGVPEVLTWHLEYCELMQYTYLKDKNGVEIYEGDILSLPETFAKLIDCERTNVLVGFKDGCFMFGRSQDAYDMNTYLYIVCNGMDLKVIGNVWEHPEILK